MELELRRGPTHSESDERERSEEPPANPLIHDDESHNPHTTAHIEPREKPHPLTLEQPRLLDLPFIWELEK